MGFANNRPDNRADDSCPTNTTTGVTYIMRELFLVALGGAVGSVFRYLISVYTPFLIGKSSLFTATLIVNLIGCFLIGALIQWMDTKQIMQTGLRLLILVGFLGGFTTYSTFGLEGFELLRESSSTAFLYIGLHILLGIGGVWFGLESVRWLLS